MKIFEWAKEIENVYKDLIEKSKNQNLKEIEILRVENEQLIDESLQKKQNLVNIALKSLNKDVKKEISQFEENLKSILKNFEQDYNQNKKKIINDIIKSLGMDFNG